MFRDKLNSLVLNLKDNEMILGKPLVVKGIAVVPVISVSLGFASGGNEGKVFGGGFGVRLNPVALIIIRDDEAFVYKLPVTKSDDEYFSFLKPSFKFKNLIT